MLRTARRFEGAGRPLFRYTGEYPSSVTREGVLLKLNAQRGFTLVELMIVVAIISILAAVALPAYQDDMRRAKLTEVVLAASTCRMTVSEIYQNRSASLPVAGAWGCEQATSSSRHVASIATDAAGGVIVTVQGMNDSAIDQKTVSFVPVGPAGGPPVASSPIYAWICGNPAAINGQAGILTTVPGKFLPSSCKG